MEKGKKRERSMNFSLEETERLIALVKDYKSVIENKKSDAVTWQEKDKTWKTLEKQFNSFGAAEVYRNAKHLKLKYEALKRDTRKKCVTRAERLNSGLNEAANEALTPIEQKVRQMIFVGVEEGESHETESTCYSDQFVTDESKEERPFEKFCEEKLKMVTLQRRLIEEELEEKITKNQMLKDEMEHKKELYRLEREEMLLKIEILKSVVNKNK